MTRGTLPEIRPSRPFQTPGGFDWIRFLFKIHGRIRRADFWLRFILPYVALQFVLYTIDHATGSFDPERGIGTLSGILSALGVWPSIAVTVKRLHDRGRSGWFILISLIPLIGPIWLLIEAGFLRGTPGSNRFGADPADPTPSG